MEPVPRLLAAAALALSFSGQAHGGISQSPDSAVITPQERGIRKPSEPPLKAPPDSGAIVVPPKVDPEAIETPPKNIDPQIAKPPPEAIKKKRKKSQHKLKPHQR